MIDPYSKNTTVAFWTDEHIAKSMLEAHLNPSIDAASRRPQTIIKTVDFIDSLLKESKIVCDYGCGPGLYTDLLQKKGHDVTGIDVSSNSLEYAIEQNPNVDYIEMNYVNDLLQKKIDFGMMIYCDFGAMDPISQSAFLKNLQYSLRKDGLFLFDVMSHAWFEKQKESYRHYSETDGFYCEGEVEIVEKVVKYPKLQLVLRSIDITGDTVMEYYNRDKCYDEEEMRILLDDNGFEIIKVYSNTYGSQKRSTSNTLCFLIRHKK